MAGLLPTASFSTASAGDPGLTNIVIVPLLSLLFAPVAPALAAGVRIDPSSVSIGLSQPAPLIATGARVGVTAPAETALRADTPTIRAGARVDASASALALSPPPPEILTGVRIDPPAVSIGLSQSAPLIASGACVDVPMLSLALQAGAPQIVAGNSIYVEASLSAPSLRCATTLSPTGVAPTASGRGFEDVMREGLLAVFVAPPPEIRAGARVDVPLLTLGVSAPSPELITRPRRIAVHSVAS